MDFHTLPRRELQALCKKNRIPANLTNVAMADALQSLQTVEGIEELQETQFLSPKKAELVSPAPPRTRGRTSTRRLGPPTKDEGKASPLPRARRVTVKASEMMDLVEGAEEENEMKVEEEEEGVPPATPNVYTRRRRMTKEENEVKKSEHVGVTTRRRAMRQSSKKELITSVATTTTTRRSTRGKGADSVKMAALGTNEEQNNEKEIEIEMAEEPESAVDEKKKEEEEEEEEEDIEVKESEDVVDDNKCNALEDNSLEENSELVEEEEEAAASENNNNNNNNNNNSLEEKEEEEEEGSEKNPEGEGEGEVDEEAAALSGLEDSPVILRLIPSEPTSNLENIQLGDNDDDDDDEIIAEEEEEVVNEILEEAKGSAEMEAENIDNNIMKMMMMMMMDRDSDDESTTILGGGESEIEVEVVENQNQIKFDVLAGESPPPPPLRATQVPSEQINAETVEEEISVENDQSHNLSNTSIFAIDNQKQSLLQEMKEFTAESSNETSNNLSFSVLTGELKVEQVVESQNSPLPEEIPVPAENKESLLEVDQVPMVAAAGICTRVVVNEGRDGGDNKENAEVAVIAAKFENMSLRKLKATYKEELVKISNNKVVEGRRSALTVLNDNRV